MGQFQALCHRHQVKIYIDRYDISCLYALIYNVTQSKKISVSDFLENPFEEIAEDTPSRGAMILATLKSVLPMDKK